MALYAFPPTSRYAGLEPATLTLPDGRVVAYLPRRLIPPPERFAALTTHPVVEGERPDTVAAAELGDSLAFWRIADANAALRPEDMTAVPGRRLRITLPEGIPAMPGADA